ncbi:MAG: DNA-binding MarR family transcriptional regulator [Chlamydiales bacterium]|jgi:DNA-binding MarR family transcriptional regulator
MSSTRPAIRQEAIGDRLHSAAIHLLRCVRESDKASGISPARLSALSVLVFAGPRTVGALADAEQVRAPTMTRLIQALEKDGLVRRKPEPEDRRAVRIEATPKARRLLVRARARRLKSVRELMDGLAAADLRVLDRAAEIMAGMASGSD